MTARAPLIVYVGDGWTDCETVKEFLSREGIAFEERNVHRDSEAAAQLRELMGRLVFPVVRFDDEEVVVGAKLDRIAQVHRRRAEWAWMAGDVPDQAPRGPHFREGVPGLAKVVVYSRPTWTTCNMVTEFLSQHGVAFEVHNPDEKPLTKDQLWDLMTLPDGRLRTPLTVVGDNVILGYDPVKPEQQFGSQAAARP